MILLSSILLTFCLFYTTNADCPSGSIQGLNPTDCYVFNSMLGSFPDAMDCNFPTSILSAAENSFIWNQAKTSFTSDYWIGGVAVQTMTQTWLWVDGRNMTYTNWAVGEPKSYGPSCDRVNFRGGAYKAVVRVDIKTGKWYTTNQTTNQPDQYFPYVCKVPNYAMPSCDLSTFVNPPDNYYAYYPIAQKCYYALTKSGPVAYKINPKSKSFVNDTCQAFDQTLQAASFHTFEQTNVIPLFLSYLVCLHSTDPFTGGYDDLFAFIGLDYDNDANSWSWDDGSTLDYTNWAAGQPNLTDENIGAGIFLHANATALRNQWVSTHTSDIQNLLGWVMCERV